VRIHYVDVYRVSAGRLGALQLVGKSAKVGREKRWKDLEVQSSKFKVEG
jgi:hypothetical protein